MKDNPFSTKPRLPETPAFGFTAVLRAIANGTTALSKASDNPYRRSAMSDDKSERGSPDSKLISLSEDHEVRYWTDHFGVTEARLREVVGRVGPSAEKVNAELRPKSR